MFDLAFLIFGGFMGSLQDKLASNLENWKTLGSVKASDKLKIAGAIAPGFGKVGISSSGILQGLFRTYTKIFSDSIADASGTTKWIGQFQGKTMNDLNSLDVRIEDCKSHHELEDLSETLHQLRSAIHESNTGLGALANTYGESRIYQSGGSFKTAMELRIQTNQVLISKIDEQIRGIGMKARSFPYEVQQSSPYGQQEANNSAQKGIKVVQDYVKGEGVDVSLKTITDKKGNTAELPAQFALDLPRSPYISLNDEVIYSNRDIETYSEVMAYRSLYKALGDSDGAVLALMTLTTQGMFADSLVKIAEIGRNELGKDVAVAKDNDIDFQYKVKIDGDVVSLTLKNGYALRDSNTGEIAGYQMTKREFHLSLKELQELNPNDKEKTLSTIDVKDTYSHAIINHVVAKDFYRDF